NEDRFHVPIPVGCRIRKRRHPWLNYWPMPPSTATLVDPAMQLRLFSQPCLEDRERLITFPLDRIGEIVVSGILFSAIHSPDQTCRFKFRSDQEGWKQLGSHAGSGRFHDR